jgi:uncharacterized membrane protein
MNTSKSPERLVFFSDAVIAIALTLLILPLTDVVKELVAKGAEPSEAITGNQWQIYSFLLSFAVIARHWVAHHRLFEHVKAYSRPLVFVNLCWLLTIAVLPFPTEMVGAFGEDRFTVLFYIGTILASSVCLTIMALIIRHNPELAKHPGGIDDQWRFNSVGTSIALAAAFVLAAAVPAVSYFAILLLLVPPLIARVRYRSTPAAASE